MSLTTPGFLGLRAGPLRRRTYSRAAPGVPRSPGRSRRGRRGLVGSSTNGRPVSQGYRSLRASRGQWRALLPEEPSAGDGKVVQMPQVAPGGGAGGAESDAREPEAQESNASPGFSWPDPIRRADDKPGSDSTSPSDSAAQCSAAIRRRSSKSHQCRASPSGRMLSI